MERGNTIQRFWELETWKRANELTKKIYEITKTYPKEERYGLVDQMRRASSSVGANIAEGFDRYHYKDKQRFYYHARGSAAEVQNFLILSVGLGFVSQDISQTYLQEYESIKRLLNGMIRSISKQL